MLDQIDVTAQEVLTEFKRRGLFDQLRKKLFTEFKDVGAAALKQRLHRQFEQALLHQDPLRMQDAKYVQQVLTKDVDQSRDGRELMDELRRSVTNKLYTRDYQSQIDADIEAVINQLLVDASVEKVEMQHQPSAEVKPVDVQRRQSQSIIDDILNFGYQPAPPVVQVVAEPTPASQKAVINSQPLYSELTPKDSREDEDLPEVDVNMPDVNAVVDITSDLSELESDDDEFDDDLVPYNRDSRRVSQESESDEVPSEDTDASEAESEAQDQEILYSEVFLRGQKLAALVDSDDGNQVWAVVIVKRFNEHTGLYTCHVPDAVDGLQDVYELPMDNLLHFNHLEKRFQVGDQVQALSRSGHSGTGRQMSSRFYGATVTAISRNIIHVKYHEGGQQAVLKYGELFVTQQ